MKSVVVCFLLVLLWVGFSFSTTARTQAAEGRHAHCNEMSFTAARLVKCVFLGPDQYGICGSDANTDIWEQENFDIRFFVKPLFYSREAPLRASSLFQRCPDHFHTVTYSHMEVAQYNYSLN